MTILPIALIAASEKPDIALLKPNCQRAPVKSAQPAWPRRAAGKVSQPAYLPVVSASIAQINNHHARELGKLTPDNAKAIQARTAAVPKQTAAHDAARKALTNNLQPEPRCELYAWRPIHRALRLPCLREFGPGKVNLRCPEPAHGIRAEPKAN